MGQGALNQGVSKTEIPDKSQMSGTKPQMALTTDKWLSLAAKGQLVPFLGRGLPGQEVSEMEHLASLEDTIDTVSNLSFCQEPQGKLPWGKAQITFSDFK